MDPHPARLYPCNDNAQSDRAPGGIPLIKHQPIYLQTARTEVRCCRIATGLFLKKLRQRRRVARLADVTNRSATRAPQRMLSNQVRIVSAHETATRPADEHTSLFSMQLPRSVSKLSSSLAFLKQVSLSTTSPAQTYRL